MKPLRTRTLRLALPLLAALAGGCYTPGPQTSAEPSPAPKAAQAKSGEAGDEDLAQKIGDAEVALQLAEIDLEVTRRKVAAEGTSAASDVAEAAFERENAAAALAHYRDLEAPKDVAEKQLGVDGAAQRLAEQRAELEQMIADYAEYDDDEKSAVTRDIVVGRERVQVEFAERRLELVTQELASLREFEVPRKVAELERKLVSKEEALEAAQRKAERGELEGRADTLRAEDKLRRARRELEELRAKAARERAE
ncbi:MAG: hypothetical protein H6828_09660 [Planctomycetes bacterium]|nr:hypothetical protein [Planctomycetota bacterium]